MVMKRSVLFQAFAALSVIAAFSFISCSNSDNNEIPDGNWDPMKIDKSEIVMSQAESCDTIKCLNYYWWITDVEENVNGVKHIHYVPYNPTDTDYCSLEGEWYSLRVPQDNQNLLIINFKENTNHDKRELIIGMSAGDIFTTLKAEQ